MNKEAYYQAIQGLGVVVDARCVERFEIYKTMIQEVNQHLNLTAIDDDEGIYLKHFYDSLLISPMIQTDATLCDIGSGAGFPGIVLAIARPDLQVTCIEPTTKRTNFLSDVVKACSLENVLIVNKRAEEAIESYRESFDVATARAVAYLDILSELCIPFVRLGGVFLSMKGSKGNEELNASKKAVAILGGEIGQVHEFEVAELGVRTVIEINKIKNTPNKYPRNYGKIKKTPLSGRKND